MHLLALAEPLAQAKLSTFIVAPREYLCELATRARFIGLLLVLVIPLVVGAFKALAALKLMTLRAQLDARIEHLRLRAKTCQNN